MPTYDTLSYNGIERRLDLWAFDLNNFVGTRNNQSADTIKGVVTDLNAGDPPIFAFEGQVTVYAGRTSPAGADNTFTGGVCKFQGKRVKYTGQGSYSGQGQPYEFKNAVYDLEQSQYLQSYAGAAANTGYPLYFPGEVVLNISTWNNSNGTGKYGTGFAQNISAGDQLQAILQWLIDTYAGQGMAAPFQYRGRQLNTSGPSPYLDFSFLNASTGAYSSYVLNGGTGGGYAYARPLATNPTIDPALFNLYLPSYIGKPMTCMAAIQKMLELSPRTSMGFDYSTTPPTIYIRSVDNFAAVSYPLFDVTTHRSLNISPREDLVARAVAITYRITETIDGNAQLNYAIDKWSKNGSNIPNSATDPDAGLRVVNDTIDLTGFTITDTSATLDCEAVAAFDVTTAQKRAWWASKRGGEVDLLTDSRIRFQALTGTAGSTGNPPTYSATATGINDADIFYASNGVDSTGVAVLAGQEFTDADYDFFTNRIVRGTHHAWMTLDPVFGSNQRRAVKSVKVKISSTMQLAEWNMVATGDAINQLPANEDTSDAAVNGGLVRAPNTVVHTVNAELTNGITGTYSTEESATVGEAYIIGAGGIAQYLFNALQIMQYEGDFVKVQANFDSPSQVSVTNCLNLTGGNPAWATMNAQIWSVREDYGTHETSVQIGISKHLSAAQLSSLLNMWRFRRPWYNPAVRADNTVGSGGQVEMPVTAGGANTTKAAEDHGIATHTQYTTPTNPSSTVKAQIILDPTLMV